MPVVVVDTVLAVGDLARKVLAAGLTEQSCRTFRPYLFSACVVSNLRLPTRLSKLCKQQGHWVHSTARTPLPAPKGSATCWHVELKSAEHSNAFCAPGATRAAPGSAGRRRRRR